MVVVGRVRDGFPLSAQFSSHVFPAPELEVARMSTDGNLPDLKFPQTGGQGNAIHLSANTLKQHGRNGEPPSRTTTRTFGCPLLPSLCPPERLGAPAAAGE